MGSRCAYCYWGDAAPTSSRWTEPGNVCVYITHSHFYLSSWKTTNLLQLYYNTMVFIFIFFLDLYLPSPNGSYCPFFIYFYLVNSSYTSNLPSSLPHPEHMGPSFHLNSSTPRGTTTLYGHLSYPARSWRPLPWASRTYRHTLKDHAFSLAPTSRHLSSLCSCSHSLL